VDSNHQEL